MPVSGKVTFTAESLDEEQAKRLLDAISGHRWELLYRIAPCWDRGRAQPPRAHGDEDRGHHRARGRGRAERRARHLAGVVRTCAGDRRDGRRRAGALRGAVHTAAAAGAASERGVGSPSGYQEPPPYAGKTASSVCWNSWSIHGCFTIKRSAPAWMAIGAMVPSEESSTIGMVTCCARSVRTRSRPLSRGIEALAITRSAPRWR